MKKNMLICAVLTALIIISGCKKADTDDKLPEAQLSVKIDGVLWTASHIDAVFDTNTQILSITGWTTDPSDFLNISFRDLEEDENPMSADGNSCTWQKYSSVNDESHTGSIIVTRCTRSYYTSGTFSFKGVDAQNMENSKIFTDGVFSNVKFRFHYENVE